MQRDEQFFTQNPGFSFSNQVGVSHTHTAPNESAFSGTIIPAGLQHPGPLHGVEFQASEVCPKNFICDQMQNRSQIMFHSSIAPKFCYPDLNILPPCVHNHVDKGESVPSSFGEDSDDINALLGSDGHEECDEDEVSTARTHTNYGSDSSGSCSSCASKPKKSRLSPRQKSSGGGSSCKGERKRQKMRKMVKVLRGIVPGGSNQMNTATVLDEAVRYLKSLTVEAQKLGVGNLNN